MAVIRVPKAFCFNSDLSKDVDENLKHQTKFVIKILIIYVNNINHIVQYISYISYKCIFMGKKK